MKNTILYIVNFYGTPPLNYFEKYIKENNKAKITILKLPAVRPLKHRFNIDAFIKDENNKTHNVNINFVFPFAHLFVFFFQYLTNFFLLFFLLSKIKRKKFDIVVGETNFGGCLSYILKKLNTAKYSVFFNGDIIPDPKWSTNCFFIAYNGRSNFFYKKIDNLLIKIQFLLRSIGYKNDLIWYANDKIVKLDAINKLVSKKTIVNDPILVDRYLTEKYIKRQKKMNLLCYIGRIDDYVGLDIVIPALKYIKDSIPDIQLAIIGGNEIAFEKYKLLAKKNNVLNHIAFYGHIPKMEKALNIMSNCALGLALYKPVKDNVSLYTQPGKPKEYIKVGIPVLLSIDGPEIGTQITKYYAGVTSKFDVESVSRIIVKILSNQKTYSKLQEGVKQFAKEYDYRKRFSKIWEEILKRYEIR